MVNFSDQIVTSCSENGLKTGKASEIENQICSWSSFPMPYRGLSCWNHRYTFNPLAS